MDVLVCLADHAGEVLAKDGDVQLFKDDGQPAAGPRCMSIAGMGKVFLSDPAVFGDRGPSLAQG